MNLFHASYKGVRFGALLNKGSLWVGAHWSAYNRRRCINPLPCVTIWIALPGGKVPAKETA